MSDNIYIYCPRCTEITLQKRDEYPIVCCNISGLTFGKGYCCCCNLSIPIDYENFDMCLTCRMASISIR